MQPWRVWLTPERQRGLCGPRAHSATVGAALVACLSETVDAGRGRYIGMIRERAWRRVQTVKAQTDLAPGSGDVSAALAQAHM